MKALERIEAVHETLNSYPITGPRWTSPEICLNDFKFLLFSFEAMREIAIDLTKKPPLMGYADEYRRETIDKIFEEAMKEKA